MQPRLRPFVTSIGASNRRDETFAFAPFLVAMPTFGSLASVNFEIS